MGANLRESLTDMDNGFVHRRDRSASNEFIDLPPLPDFYDNRDLAQREENIQNYKSNDNNKNIFSSLAEDGDDFHFEIGFADEENNDNLDMGIEF